MLTSLLKKQEDPESQVEMFDSETDFSTSTSSDYELYRYQICDKKVIEFNMEDHKGDINQGKDPS